jgi:hypothetical protein
VCPTKHQTYRFLMTQTRDITQRPSKKSRKLRSKKKIPISISRILSHSVILRPESFPYGDNPMANERMKNAKENHQLPQQFFVLLSA